MNSIVVGTTEIKWITLDSISYLPKNTKEWRTITDARLLATVWDRHDFIWNGNVEPDYAILLERLYYQLNDDDRQKIGTRALHYIPATINPTGEYLLLKSFEVECACYLVAIYLVRELEAPPLYPQFPEILSRTAIDCWSCYMQSWTLLGNENPLTTLAFHGVIFARTFSQCFVEGTTRMTAMMSSDVIVATTNYAIQKLMLTRNISKSQK
jgi:hypothetical protein